MKSKQITSSDQNAIFRITALWALSESGIGGIMHALKIPFTGLVVGGISIILISLICTISNNKWHIVMQSLLTVLAIKLAISPHSAITAYFAVTFQGVFGWIIYRTISHTGFAAMIMAIVCMLESAFQKLIVLTLFYGNSLWQAIDTFGEWVATQFGFVLSVSSSKILILSYLGLYLAGGIITGIVASYLVKQIQVHATSTHYRISISDIQTIPETSKSVSRNKTKKWLFAGLIVFFVVAMILLENSGSQQKVLYYILRVGLIFTIWYGVLNPLMIKGMKKYMNRDKKGVSTNIQSTVSLFPYLRGIVQLAWRESKPHKNRRLIEFIKGFILYSIHFEIKANDLHSERSDQKR